MDRADEPAVGHDVGDALDGLVGVLGVGDVVEGEKDPRDQLDAEEQAGRPPQTPPPMLEVEGNGLVRVDPERLEVERNALLQPLTPRCAGGREATAVQRTGAHSFRSARRKDLLSALEGFTPERAELEGSVLPRTRLFDARRAAVMT